MHEPATARHVLAGAGFVCLEDAEATVAGLRFYGSPWQPAFHDWAFNLPRGEPLAAVWRRIPARVDVLVTKTAARGATARRCSRTSRRGSASAHRR